MKPLDLLCLFLFVALALVFLHDAEQDDYDHKADTQSIYTASFQAAVDDAGYYLSRLESQQLDSAIRYQHTKEIDVDHNVTQVFFDDLALKFNVAGNPYEMESLKEHVPVMMLIEDDGYIPITLDDTAGGSTGSSQLTPTFWPKRPYSLKLQNGNILYFTLYDQATVYDPSTNQWTTGDYDTLASEVDLGEIDSSAAFEEEQQTTITASIERDMAGAVNRHLDVMKRLGLQVSFTMPRGVDQESIQNIGFLAFLQGYPLPDGERFDAFSFGGGSVQSRTTLVGGLLTSGQLAAYPQACVPAIMSTQLESFANPTEAVKKGYFVYDCP